MVRISLDAGDMSVLWGVFGDHAVPLRDIPRELADLLVGISVARQKEDKPRLIRLGLIGAHAGLTHATKVDDARIPSGGTIVPPEGTPPGTFIVANYTRDLDLDLISRGEAHAERAGIVLTDEEIGFAMLAREMLKAFSVWPRTAPPAAPAPTAEQEARTEPKRRGRPRKLNGPLTGAERARMYRERQHADGVRLIQVSVPDEHVELVRTVAVALRRADQDLAGRLLQLVS